MKLTINGKSIEVHASPDTPLLWALRDELGLTGTKYGCGIGKCGTCTVHVNGVAERSCQITIDTLAGKSVTTIEGLSDSNAAVLHPVQQAWLDCDVVQCGYCQPGQMMAAAALLKRNAKPTEAEISTAMSEQLCRCGTYERVRAGVHRAAELVAAGPASKGTQ
jgi:isoquinoline 1-oxidoreductase subunit alpha